MRINRNNPIQYDFEWGRWEWAFSLPFLDTANQSKMGVWEDNGRIVALAAFEGTPDTIYFCIDADYNYLKRDLLLYAKENLGSAEGKLKVLINNTDRTMQRIAAQLGFHPLLFGSSANTITRDRNETQIFADKHRVENLTINPLFWGGKVDD